MLLCGESFCITTALATCLSRFDQTAWRTAIGTGQPFNGVIRPKAGSVALWADTFYPLHQIGRGLANMFPPFGAAMRAQVKTQRNAVFCQPCQRLLPGLFDAKPFADESRLLQQELLAIRDTRKCLL